MKQIGRRTFVGACSVIVTSAYVGTATATDGAELEVTAKPNGAIWIDGKRIGEGRVRVPLTHGVHTIQVGQERPGPVFKVSLTRNERRQVQMWREDVALEQMYKREHKLAELTVFANPWGNVWINGEPKGRAPVTVRVPAGFHVVQVGSKHPESPYFTRISRDEPTEVVMLRDAVR